MQRECQLRRHDRFGRNVTPPAVALVHGPSHLLQSTHSPNVGEVGGGRGESAFWSECRAFPPTFGNATTPKDGTTVRVPRRTSSEPRGSAALVPQPLVPQPWFRDPGSAALVPQPWLYSDGSVGAPPKCRRGWRGQGRKRLLVGVSRVSSDIWQRHHPERRNHGASAAANKFRTTWFRSPGYAPLVPPPWFRAALPECRRSWRRQGHMRPLTGVSRITSDIWERHHPESRNQEDGTRSTTTRAPPREQHPKQNHASRNHGASGGAN